MLLPAALAALTGQVEADEAIGPLRSTSDRPLAVRGGVLMLPLAVAAAGYGWPESTPLTLADGSTVPGSIAWIHPAPPRADRYWTEEPRRLAVRLVRPDDDTSIPGTGRPVLLARLPANGTGPITLGDQMLDPVWLDPPLAPPSPLPSGVEAAGNDRSVLAMIRRADLPDPASPFAWWRWVLLARRLGVEPPSEDVFGRVGRLLAEHEAKLWRIGFDRLQAVSPGVAAHCLDSLTATCRDDSSPSGRFAAWETDPAQAAALLAILLDFELPPEQMADNALAWADNRDPLLLWTEAGYGGRIRLTLANPTDDAPVARFTWLSVIDDIPIAAQLDPESSSRISIDRPPAPGPPAVGLPAPPEPESQVLLVEIGSRSRQLSFGRPVTIARPPGAFFHTLKPTLRLFEVRAQLQKAAQAERATYVHLRRRAGRWEVFFNCRRPPHEPSLPPAFGDDDITLPSPQNAAIELADCSDWTRTVGLEAVTIIIGPEEEQGGPAVVLSVPETGWHRLFAGANDGTMQIHRRSYADRWLCRIVLPDAWLFDPVDPEAPLLLGAMRTHGDCSLVQTAPNPAVPWRAVPTRAAIDLMQWDSPPPR